MRKLLCLPLLLLTAAAPTTSQQWLTSTFNGRDPQAIAIVKAHQKLALSATKHLSYCTKGELDPDQQPWRCALDQYDFVLDYIRAFYGYPRSQFDLALILTGSGPMLPPRSYVQPGVHRDPIEGCAWSFVLASTDAPEPITPYIACAGLDDADANTAFARSKVLAAAIAAHLAHGDKPPDIFPPF